MGRLRSRWGSCLALFALTLQLALSFGHVHLGPITRDSFAANVATGTDAHRPASRDRHDLPAAADDNCAVCALIHLAGTLLPSEPPALELPAAFGRLSAEILGKFDLTAPPGALFQARAPPIA